MDRILVIGGNGFIGANLVNELVGAGHKIVVFGPEVKNSNIKPSDSVDFVYGSLNESLRIKQIFQSYTISQVIHLVSTMIPSSKSVDYCNEINNVILPTQVLLDEMRLNNVHKIVFISSGGTVYGSYKESGIYSEEDLKKPISYYGLSKAQLEDLILFHHRVHGLEYLILRPSNPFGRFQNLYGEQGIIPVTIGKIKQGENVEIWGDGSVIRDFISIDYLVNAIVELINKGVVNEIVNIGSGVGYSIKEVIDMIGRNIDVHFKVSYNYSARRNDVTKSILDTSKLRDLITIKSENIESAIRKFCHDSLKSML